MLCMRTMVRFSLISLFAPKLVGILGDAHLRCDSGEQKICVLTFDNPSHGVYVRHHEIE